MENITLSIVNAFLHSARASWRRHTLTPNPAYQIRANSSTPLELRKHIISSFNVKQNAIRARCQARQEIDARPANLLCQNNLSVSHSVRTCEGPGIDRQTGGQVLERVNLWRAPGSQTSRCEDTTSCWSNREGSRT